MPNYLLLFLEPLNTQLGSFPKWREEIFSQHPDIITPWLYLDATDGVNERNRYRRLDIYRLTNEASLSSSQMEQLLQSRSAVNHVSTFHWQIYKDIAEVRPSSSSSPPVVVVTVGLTVPPDSVSWEELDKWYTQEHMPALATVPGWQAGTRLQLMHASEKDAEYAAPSLAIHEWGEPNELGGESWRRACLTPWSERIMEQQIAPTHRRVWKSVQALGS